MAARELGGLTQGHRETTVAVLSLSPDVPSLTYYLTGHRTQLRNTLLGEPSHTFIRLAGFQGPFFQTLFLNLPNLGSLGNSDREVGMCFDEADVTKYKFSEN